LPNPGTTQKVKTPKQKDLPFLKGETFELSQLSTVQLQLECGLSKSEDGGEEEERSLINELQRFAGLAITWDWHGSLVPR
jgi:hypothetical protein